MIEQSMNLQKKKNHNNNKRFKLILKKNICEDTYLKFVPLNILNITVIKNILTFNLFIIKFSFFPSCVLRSCKYNFCFKLVS